MNMPGIESVDVLSSLDLSAALYVPDVRGQTKSEIHRNRNSLSQHCQDNKLQYSINQVPVPMAARSKA